VEALVRRASSKLPQRCLTQVEFGEEIMKRLLLIISILALVLLPIGCSAQNMMKDTIESMLAGLTVTYTIEVGGTEGLNFSGRYVVVTEEYDPVNYVASNSYSYDVSGNVPAQYTAENAISVAGMFQKKSEEGTLEVKILKGGELIDSANTSDPWGAVLVTAAKQG
jgi:hypothetical protein